MESEFDSESQFSNANDEYIKKHINAVERGESAVFGDPLSEEKDDMRLPSSQNSQQEYQQPAQNSSKIDFDENKSKQEIKEEPNKYSEEGQQFIDLLEPRGQPKVEAQIKKQRDPIKEQKVEPEKREQSIRQQQRQPIIAIQNGQIIQQNQEKESQPLQPQQAEGPAEDIVNQDEGWVIQQKILPGQEVREDLSEQTLQRLRLKQERGAFLQMNEDQMNLILEGFKKNTQSIETAYNHILDQNTILAQFKQDASRKLEENIKLTLKEKMNEINRQNSKEIKDIKNLTSGVQDLLKKHESRLDKMEKSIEEILNLVKNRK